jgi:transaldolase
MLMTNLNNLHGLFQQSPWLDNLSRHLLDDGTIQGYIDKGIRGVTSNPTIFEKALADSTAYDQAIEESGLHKSDAETLYWQLAVADIQKTADLLRPVFDESGGQDGYVSLEVSPELSHDAEATIIEARDLRQRVNRPNLMIKVPATRECLAAITQLTSEGFCVNVTLIFSIERYREVVSAYMAGLEQCDGDPKKIHSVASFFVSRIDSEVDTRLVAINSEDSNVLLGKTAVAQARQAFQAFTEMFNKDDARWAALAERGATVQRPLWASTSTKNPSYNPLLYVTSLVAANTVNTLPNATLDAILQAPTETFSVECGITPDSIWASGELLARLEATGVNMAEVTALLEKQGIQKFHEAFQAMIASLAAKMPA